MNFYKRFIGDITAKTGGLTLAQMGAYDRLLDHYYSTEQPIPPEECYSVCRAMSKADRTDVDKVLARFWDLTPEGYIQTKADEVIAKARPLIDAARENGKKGGRPCKVNNPDETQRVSKDNPEETQGESYPKPKPKEIPNSPTVSVDSPDGEPPKTGPTRIPCPYNDLLAAFHAECPTLPRVMKLSSNRRTTLAARWKEVDADSRFESVDDGVEIFRAIFKRANASDFLSGRSGKFKTGFDWLVKAENFLKLCEGNYDNRSTR